MSATACRFKVVGDPLPPPPRRELLRDAVVEAARALLAAELRRERVEGARLYSDLDCQVADALQTLRECLSAERAARGES